MFAKNNRVYNLALMAVDIFVLLLAFVAAYVLRVTLDDRPLLNAVYAYDYLLLSVAVIPIWIIIFAFLGLYNTSTHSRRLLEWSKLAIGAFMGILVIIGWEYVTQVAFFPARLVAVYALVAAFVFLVFAREISRAARSLVYLTGRGTYKLLIIGNTEAIADIATSLSDTKRSGYEVVALAAPKKFTPKGMDVKHYSRMETALGNLERDGITAIIQTDLYDNVERNQRILGAAQQAHISYSFIPGEPEFYSGKNTIDVFLGYPMINVYQTPLVGWGAIVKRFFDQIVSGILILLLSPIFILIALLQKIVNPGPVFYTSKRLSRFSEPIDLIKFRSMGAKYGSKDAADEFREMGREDLAFEYEKYRKVEKDPRITKFGAFLRKTSLDELPQLFNVWKGELSLVGPRPILPQEAHFARSRTPLLHSVKSGMTGLWQVSGRSSLSFDERIELELFYAQNWSFWLDIKILFKTIKVVFRRDGAK